MRAYFVESCPGRVNLAIEWARLIQGPGSAVKDVNPVVDKAWSLGWRVCFISSAQRFDGDLGEDRPAFSRGLTGDMVQL